MNGIEKEVCLSCQGTGKCFKCGGAGHVVHESPAPMAVVAGDVRSGSRSSTRRTCPKCLGSGTCSACKGTGKSS